MAPPPPPLCWADAPPYHYHGDGAPLPQPRGEEKGGEDGSASGPRSLWIGGLLHWMNEDYLYCCFTRSPELVSLVIKRNNQTGHSEGFGFLNFADHTTAYQILKSYNGQSMPNSNQNFNINWATQDKTPDQDSNLNWPTQTQHQDAPHTNTNYASSHHSIFVGDLAFDVTDFMLHHLFKARYPSVKSAKVIFNKATGRSKGYGFVQFGDANEHLQAVTEMNGVYCSTRPMRIRPAPNKKTTYTFRPDSVHDTQGIDSDQDPNNSKLFVGCLDQSVTYEDLLQAFSPYGELVDVKVLVGKDCGFVTYSNRASAEEALKMLNGSQLRGSTIKLSWGRRSGNKQDQWNGGRHGRPQCFDPSGFGWSAQGPYAYAQAGHPGYVFYQQLQLPLVQ